MVRTRSALAPLALAALLALAPSPAEAARRAPRRKGPAPARFEVVRTEVRGALSSVLDQGEDANYRYSGRAEYVSSVDDDGVFVVPARPSPGTPTTLEIDGLQYEGVSEARLATRTRTWRCDLVTPDAWAPTSIAGIVSFTRTRMRVQWGLLPAAFRCPADAPIWSFPAQPARVMTSEYSLATLRSVRPGQLGRLWIRIDERWSDQGGEHHLRWRGTIMLERLR